MTIMPIVYLIISTDRAHASSPPPPHDTTPFSLPPVHSHFCTGAISEPLPLPLPLPLPVHYDSPHTGK